MTFCGNCGTNNPAGNRFCFNCGAELTVPSEEPRMNYAPQNEEVERIGAYNPNIHQNVSNQPPQQQQFQQPPGYQQQYQQQPYQQYAPPAGQYQNQQYGQYPGQQYGQYQDPQYGQYQGQQYNQYPGQQYGQYQQDPPKQLVYLYGAPNNNVKMRIIAIIVSIAALAVAMVALFAIPSDLSDFGTTLLSLGLGEDGMIVLVFVIISLVVGIIGLLIPIFSIVTGVCIIATAALILTNPGFSDTMDITGMLVFVVMAVLVMGLGLLSSLMMSKYVRANVRNVNMLQCSIMTWTGVRVPQEYPGQNQQYQY